jgi:hypothetical protein
MISTANCRRNKLKGFLKFSESVLQERRKKLEAKKENILRNFDNKD